jgi:6-phosphogluconate dehydrogenase (decarboxylating)
VVYSATKWGVGGYVPDLGEGRWTIADAIDLDVPTPMITLPWHKPRNKNQSDERTCRQPTLLYYE